MLAAERSDDPRLVIVLGVEYYVPWEQLTPGASFFMPTTATPKQVELVLKPVASKLGIRLLIRTRREYGRYGVRVWRTY